MIGPRNEKPRWGAGPETLRGIDNYPLIYPDLILIATPNNENGNVKNPL